jgi:hypothetical protein
MSITRCKCGQLIDEDVNAEHLFECDGSPRVYYVKGGVKNV